MESNTNPMSHSTPSPSPIPTPHLKEFKRCHSLHLKKKVANYSLSGLFGIKAYTLTSEVSIQTLCDGLEIDTYTFCQFNSMDRYKLDVILGSGQRVLLPTNCNKEYIQAFASAEITIDDVTGYKLEECKQMLYPESFYVCYMTTRGDIIGTLTFYENFLHFRPVSMAYSGMYDFETYSLTKNDKMEFKIDYRDILGDPEKIPLPNMEESWDEDAPPMVSWVMQVPLCNNGYASWHSEDTKVVVGKFTGQGDRICSLCVKVRTKTLTGMPLTDEEQEEILDRILMLTNRRVQAMTHPEEPLDLSNTPNETCVPYFDIQWNLIFGNKPKVDFVNSNLQRLHDIFGFNSKIAHLSLIQNQSMIP